MKKIFGEQTPTTEDLKEFGEIIDKVSCGSIDLLLKIISETGHYSKNISLLKKSLEADDKKNADSVIKELLDDFFIKRQALLELRKWVRKGSKSNLTGEAAIKKLLDDIGFNNVKVSRKIIQGVENGR